jgi:hypothetical protein
MTVQFKGLKQMEKEIETLKSNNAYLLEQQKVFVKMAESAGTKEKRLEHELIRLREEFESFKRNSKPIR